MHTQGGTSCSISKCHAICEAFTIIECLASLALLGVICSGIVMAIGRSMDLTEDLTLRVRAFTVACENMEKILTSVSLEESLEGGTSELYPLIDWETSVEVFNEPVEGNPWSRAVCRASYLDHKNEKQTIELVEWLGPVEEKALAGKDQGKVEGTRAFNYEEALEYANVDEETFGLWVEWGLKQLPNGDFLQYNLDIFVRANGAQPTEEEIGMQVDSARELEEPFEDAQEDAADPLMEEESDMSSLDAGEDLNLSIMEEDGGGRR